jgi:hypothetical protein
MCFFFCSVDSNFIAKDQLLLFMGLAVPVLFVLLPNIVLYIFSNINN